MNVPRIIFVGGFLGAGKTTLMFEAAKQLATKGVRAGLITNDQAPELVDTVLLKKTGTAVTEVSGSCFCCNFQGLVNAIGHLTQGAKADIVLAEPVGSCTDLSATLVQPLMDNKGGHVTVAPLTVLVDPMRLEGIRKGNSTGLHDSSTYIFRKQLEEADIILISKADTLSHEKISDLGVRLASSYPKAEVLAVSARNGLGVETWLEAVMTTSRAGTHLADVDYDIYAEGEAVLGWLNATYQLKSTASIDWKAFAEKLMGALSEHFDSMAAEVGHVKLALCSGDSLITANLVGTRDTLEAHSSFRGESAKLTLNARVQMSPLALENIIREHMQSTCGSIIQAEPIAWRCLSPGRPTPTYRYSAAIPVAKRVGL